MPESTKDLRDTKFTALKKIASKYKEFMPPGYSKWKASEKEELVKAIVKASRKAEHNNNSSEKEKPQKSKIKPECDIPMNRCEKGTMYKKADIQELAKKCGLTGDDLKGSRKKLCEKITEALGGKKPSSEQEKPTSKTSSKDTGSKKPSSGQAAEGQCYDGKTRDELMKMTAGNLKDMLGKAKISPIPSSKAGKVEFLCAAGQGKRCDPKNDNFCEDDEHCDLAAELCVTKDHRKLEEMIYNGKKIIGTSAALKKLSALLEKRKAEEPKAEEPEEEEPEEEKREPENIKINGISINKKLFQFIMEEGASKETANKVYAMANSMLPQAEVKQQLNNIIKWFSEKSELEEDEAQFVVMLSKINKKTEQVQPTTPPKPDTPIKSDKKEPEDVVVEDEEEPEVVIDEDVVVEDEEEPEVVIDEDVVVEDEEEPVVVQKPVEGEEIVDIEQILHQIQKDEDVDIGELAATQKSVLKCLGLLA